MTIALLLLAALVALAVAAFCAGTETAFLSVSRERILHLAREGGRKAAIVQKALSALPRTTTTLLIGNNLASVAYSSATAALAGALFSQRAVCCTRRNSCPSCSAPRDRSGAVSCSRRPIACWLRYFVRSRRWA